VETVWFSIIYFFLVEYWIDNTRNFHTILRTEKDRGGLHYNMENGRSESTETPTITRIHTGRFASKVFNLILAYKNSKIFQMINRHQGLAIVLLVLWGMLIMGMFMWFVVSHALRQ